MVEYLKQTKRIFPPWKQSTPDPNTILNEMVSISIVLIFGRKGKINKTQRRGPVQTS